jgi:hypothetical protein
MSGQNGPDEAARLEQALARIARAAARRPAAGGEVGALHGAAPRATSPDAGPDTAEIAARLDSLIAELRALLAPHEF